MNVLIARLGQSEIRRTAQTIWIHGKRKRAGGDWTCVQCTQQSRHKRWYSDATLRWMGGVDLNLGKLAADEAARQEAWGLESTSTDSVGGRLELEYTGVDAGREDLQSGAFFTDRSARPEREEEYTLHRDVEQGILWEQLEADGLVKSNADDAAIGSSGIGDVARRRARFARIDLTKLDYKTALAPALAKGESDMVARCLFAAETVKDADFVGSMPESTFSAILELLQPENHINKLASVHVDLSPALVRHLMIAPMRKIASEYAYLLEQVFLIRRSKNQRVGLSDYKILLRSARDLGDRQMAKFLWTALHEDDHRPDTACFNYYMASVVWNGVHDDVLRQRRRVVPYNLALRQRDDTVSGDYRVGHEGVRDQALSMFGNMLKAGVVADEQSYVILMTAAAREGDMKTVKSFLKKIWDFDVDALLGGAREAKIKPRPIAADSPLRPTGDFLVALAHIFGMNNDIPAALHVIDFAARQYSIDVPERMWSVLIEWTFVLADSRSGTSRNNGSKVGELPRQSMVRLWDTMTGAPYFVKPSMAMYNFLIRNLARRRHPKAISEKMEEAYNQEYLPHRAAAIESRKKLVMARSQGHEKSVSDVSLENLRRQWEYYDTVRRRDVIWLKRWMRLFLGSLIEWNRMDRVFVTERVPSLLWQWCAMAPTTVRYETPTGIVEFNIRTEEDMQRNAEHIDSVRYENERLRRAVPRFVGHDWLQGKPSKRLPQARGRLPRMTGSEKVDRVPTNEGIH